MEAAQRVKAKQLERRRELAKELRAVGEKAMAESSESLVEMAKQRYQEKREVSKTYTAERGKRESGYLDRARANREKARATRERAKVAAAEALEVRKRAVSERHGHERSNTQAVSEEKARLLASQRREVAKSWRARFASQGAAAEYENSHWRVVSAAAAWFSPGTSVARSTASLQESAGPSSPVLRAPASQRSPAAAAAQEKEVAV